MKPDKFEKGDYIVNLYRNSRTGAHLLNHCYKQRENTAWLKPVLDSTGGKANGWPEISIQNIDRWRLASKEEIAMYEAIGKPFNTCDLDSTSIPEAFKPISEEDKIYKVTTEGITKIR